MKRVGVIHATLSAVKPLEMAFFEFGDDLEPLNFVDEYMLKRIKDENGLTKKAKREFLKLVFRAVESNVDAVLVACTVYCPLVPLVREFVDVPVIAIDEPMMENVLDQPETKIGVIATNLETAENAKRILDKMNMSRGLSKEVITKVTLEAFEALKDGNEEQHNFLIGNAASELMKQGADIIILAQISMARAEQTVRDLGVKVLSSPKEGVLRLKRILGK